MNHIGSNRIGKWVLALLLLTIFIAPQLFAVGTDPEPTTAQAQNRPSGFKIGKTRMWIGAHAGMNFPNAASNLFGFITNELTLKKRDFQAPLMRFNFGFAFQSHFAAVAEVEYSKATADSSYRHWVNEVGDEIIQTTRFRQIPITGTLRYYPVKMGESVGSYVWIPARFNPYIAAGAGAMYYNFSQQGDFINFKSANLEIRNKELTSNGSRPIAHLAGGFDINISSRIFANFEARYAFGSAKPSTNFAPYDSLDLWGLKTSGGIGVRF
jgi:outer membrane protein W